ncbi:hypothetical protein IVB25_23400 [Bradyrhizobium sp. 193]|uniref:hypothetical protein n=1 Tax=Bradyrhizobium sp. 193 TaxID=2782661 RepID=UPI001FF84D4E|nr:hypothetical protein [Bradyrhizobium sp. 193]MCK1485555.1 hypothetical protein [Bradyrhizobium sp. 193]
MSDQDAKYSDLVEIAKRSGEFREHYGKWWGGFIQLSFANKAVGRRPFLWGGLVTLGTIIGGVALRYGLTLIGH